MRRTIPFHIRRLKTLFILFLAFILVVSNTNTIWINASLSVPIKRLGKTYLPVTFFRTRTSRPAFTINMLVDTGGPSSKLSREYGEKLGIDIEGDAVEERDYTNAYGDTGTYYKHYLWMQIDNLKRVRLPFGITEAKGEGNVLGWIGVLDEVRLQITGGLKSPRLVYEEVAAALGMSNIFRGRI